jgi:hypothetical protein
MLTTAGISADIRFDPKAITNRLKKSIQRQITNGVITGGYSSHASRVAKYLCRQFKIKYTDNHWYGVRVPTVALVQADLAAYLLTENAYNPQWDKDKAYQTIVEIRAGLATVVRTHHHEFNDRIHALVAELRTPEEIQRAKEVALLLDLGEPITIHHYNAGD